MNIALNHSRGDTPLCVDLDGTLIRSDLLHEAVFMLLRLNFLYLFVLPLWWFRGKAQLKAEIAKRVMPDVTHLPYNHDLIDWLKAQKNEGRRLVLATASNERYANAVATHLGLFESVDASDAAVNLSGSAKTKRLVDRFGAKGFDYVGNGKADVVVWDEAREAVTVGREAAAVAYSKKEHATQFLQGAHLPRMKVWLKAMRVHQWLKNTLLFVPAILATRYFDGTTILSVTIAFIAFSLCASSVYLLNDLIDIEVDRKHETKHKRPIPAGNLPIAQAATASGIFLLSAFALSLFLPLIFTGVLAIYYIVTCTYSFYLKRLLLIDVLTLAGLFTIRVLAGSAAIGGMVSTWLLAFCMFFFLSLALVKRFVELSTQFGQAGRKVTGRGYRADDLEALAQGGMASGFAAVLVLALFIDSPQITENYSNPMMIWLVCPLVLYLIMRIWILARRSEMHDDPVVFLMTDWRSQIMIGAGAILMLFSQMM